MASRSGATGGAWLRDGRAHLFMLQGLVPECTTARDSKGQPLRTSEGQGRGRRAIPPAPARSAQPGNRACVSSFFVFTPHQLTLLPVHTRWSRLPGA